MGTRAQFFIGDPRDVLAREYLGTVAWDGYPDGDIGEAFENVTTASEFREAVAGISERRNDYADPKERAFPFPWKDDLFLTDCTYAFFDDAVQFTWYHTGFVPLARYQAFTEEESEAYANSGNHLPKDTPAPRADDKPLGTDSIMVVSLAN